MTLYLLIAGALVTVAPAHLRTQTPGDTAGVGDLPLIEQPAPDTGQTLAILLTGDGGWATIDRQIAAELGRRGIAVVGLNMKEYLGTERTPVQASADLMRVVRTFAKRWHRGRIVVVGYSRGADLAPFAVAGFPVSLRDSVALMALIGLAPAANFKWHLMDVVRDIKRSSDRPVRPELDRLTTVPTLCIYGADEHTSGCLDAPPAVRRIERPGGHHMDGNYTAVADLIVDAIPR